MARLARDVGYPSYASDSASPFIPQIWSSLMIEQFYPATTVGAIANTNYENEIKGFGDSVVIRISPELTITDWVVGQDLTYETPEGSSVLLEINKAKSFAFEISAVDRYQADIDLMTDWSEKASMNLAVNIDRSVLGDVYTEAAPENQGAAAGALSGDINLGVAGLPVALDRTNVLEWIVNMGTVFDEQNVPQTERCLIVPAKVLAHIKLSDLKDASIAGDGTSILRNGRVGMIDRFTLYHSNLLNQTGGEYDVIAAHKSGLTFAAQIDEEKLKHLPHPTRHAELVRGLVVYGYQVIKPESMIWSVVTA